MLGGLNPFWHVLSLHSYRPALNSSELCTDSSTILYVFSTVTNRNKDKGRHTVMAGQGTKGQGAEHMWGG